MKDVRFPAAPSFPFADLHAAGVADGLRTAIFRSTRVITSEPPQLGAPYRLLVPQVNADGNDVSGIRLPEVAVPLGTYTGWNVTVPQLSDLGYLAGLIGGFEPFAAHEGAAGTDRRCSSLDWRALPGPSELSGSGQAGRGGARPAAVHAPRGCAGGGSESRRHLECGGGRTALVAVAKVSTRRQGFQGLCEVSRLEPRIDVQPRRLQNRRSVLGSLSVSAARRFT